MAELPYTFTVLVLPDRLVPVEAAASMVGQKFPMRIGDFAADEAEVVGARSRLPEPGVELVLESVSARLERALATEIGPGDVSIRRAP